MGKWIGVLVVVTVLVVSQAAWGESRRQYALIIGIDQYQDKRIPDLKNAVSDAKALRDVLVSDYGFKPENVRELYDADATRENILSKLLEFARMSFGKYGSLFIYYSGHGQFEPSIKSGFWIPHDADKDKYPSSYINNSELRDYLGGVKAKHTLVVSDSCFSGALLSSRATRDLDRSQGDRYFKEIMRRSSRKIMLSGGMKEEVADGSMLDKCEGHSIFACYFLEALRENDGEYITGDEVFGWLQIPVTNNSRQTPAYAPLADSGDEGGEFVFVRRGGVVPGDSVSERPEDREPQDLCTPRAEKACYDGNIYSYDSCGNRGSLYEDCGSNTSCHDGSCACDSGYVMKAGKCEKKADRDAMSIKNFSEDYCSIRMDDKAAYYKLFYMMAEFFAHLYDNTENTEYIYSEIIKAMEADWVRVTSCEILSSDSLPCDILYKNVSKTSYVRDYMETNVEMTQASVDKKMLIMGHDIGIISCGALTAKYLYANGTELIETFAIVSDGNDMGIIMPLSEYRSK
ncbi:caspase family protein [bacterium]